jgi:hypothetical protein
MRTVIFNTPAGKLEAALVRSYKSSINVLDSEGKPATVLVGEGKKASRKNVVTEIEVCDLIVCFDELTPEQVDKLGATNEQKRAGYQVHTAVLGGTALWRAAIKV